MYIFNAVMIFKKQNYFVNNNPRTFKDFIPPVSILIGGIIFIGGTLLAIFKYQTVNGGYDFFNQFFSELGVRNDYVANLPGGATETRYAPPNPEIFNTTLYLSGILLIPFFAFSYRQMRNSNRISNFMLSIAIAGGILSGIMMIGVGIYDLSYVANYVYQMHGFWVSWLYILITVTSFTWYLMLITARRLPYKKSKWVWVDVILLLLQTIFTIVNILDGFQLIFVKDIPLLNIFPIETYQKFIAYLYFGYFGLIVGVRLSKTKYDNTPAKKSVESLYCTNCGKSNFAEAMFCHHCLIKM